eukprot:2764992-Rhodomonas_salina.1
MASIGTSFLNFWNDPLPLATPSEENNCLTRIVLHLGPRTAMSAPDVADRIRSTTEILHLRTKQPRTAGAVAKGLLQVGASGGV